TVRLMPCCLARRNWRSCPAPPTSFPSPARWTWWSMRRASGSNAISTRPELPSGGDAMLFSDRIQAGRQLARALDRYRGKDVVVLALPRGGVPVAREVALHLKAPIDLLLVRKIGVPMQPELAMGAVIDGDDPVVVRNDHVIRLA